MSSIKKLEDLPNEILFECFKYLNTFHLFYSFDDSNYRFYKLIQSINLRLDSENVDIPMIEEFFHKTREEPLIKEKIISINLSDKRSFDESNRILLNYSIEEFPNLKCLFLGKRTSMEHSIWKIEF